MVTAREKRLNDIEYIESPRINRRYSSGDHPWTRKNTLEILNYNLDAFERYDMDALDFDGNTPFTASRRPMSSLHSSACASLAPLIAILCGVAGRDFKRFRRRRLALRSELMVNHTLARL